MKVLGIVHRLVQHLVLQWFLHSPPFLTRWPMVLLNLVVKNLRFEDRVVLSWTHRVLYCPNCRYAHPLLNLPLRSANYLLFSNSQIVTIKIKIRKGSERNLVRRTILGQFSTANSADISAAYLRYKHAKIHKRNIKTARRGDPGKENGTTTLNVNTEHLS